MISKPVVTLLSFSSLHLLPPCALTLVLHSTIQGLHCRLWPRFYCNNTTFFFFPVTRKPAFISYFIMSVFPQKYCLIWSQLKVISSSTILPFSQMFLLCHWSLLTFYLVSVTYWERIRQVLIECQVHTNSFCKHKKTELAPLFSWFVILNVLYS